MRKLLIIWLMLLCAGIIAHAKKVAEFEEVLKDPFVLLDNKQIYLWSRSSCKFYIYSRKDNKKIAEFGRRGEGPGEFMTVTEVSLTKDFLVISNFPKVSFFTKKGELVKEIKRPSNAGGFVPIGENFIGASYPSVERKAKKGKTLYSLYDDDLEKIKDIRTVQFRKYITYGGKKQQASLLNDYFEGFVYKDSFYIGATDNGFYFFVCDQEGNKLYEISKTYKKRRVTKSDKLHTLDRLRKAIGEAEWKKRKMYLEYTFPEFYPAYANFYIDNDKIYVFPFPETNRQGVVIMDLKGNVLKTKYIDHISTAETKACIEMGRFTMRYGKIYYLKDNYEDDNLELHAVQID
ncbi:MAG: hypothetical protein GY765_32980 [bacterium]|nr:hypothetical protein [bacterium]